MQKGMVWYTETLSDTQAGTVFSVYVRPVVQGSGSDKDSVLQALWFVATALNFLTILSLDLYFED